MRLDYPLPSNAAVSAVMRGNRKTDTAPEVRIRSAIHRRGMRFRKHVLVRASSVNVRPDIVFTRQRVAVFVDGCFWHCCPVHGNRPRSNSQYWEAKLARNRSRDAAVNAALRAEGWDVLRVWEHESSEDAAEAICAVVSDQARQAVQASRGTQ